MKTKERLRLEIKEITEQGVFEGLLSPYGNVDEGGDVVEPGAFTKTLQEQGATRPLLWQHKTDMPIGDLTLEERPEGLWCKGQLLMDLPKAKEAYLLMKAKIVRGLSIGFLAVKDSVSNNVRRLKEIKLYEGSVVTFPMNTNALIASIKARDGETKGDFNEELTELQLSDAGYQMRCALSRALDTLFWSGLSKEEMITTAQVVIQQFSDAYMSYLPAYIDMLTEYYGDMETWAQKRMETKAGATFSAANKQTIKSACDSILSGHSALIALVAEEAGTSTSETKAADLKTEPEPRHSAAESLIDSMRSLIPVA